MEETVVFSFFFVFFWLTRCWTFFALNMRTTSSDTTTSSASAADLIKYIKRTIVSRELSPPDWRSVGTPKLPFVSVFPGKNTDTDVIENANVDRKYRQSRWLQAPPASPFLIKKKCCGANDSGKVANATRQTKLKPAKEQRSQRHNPRNWRNGQKLWAIRRKRPAPSPPSRPGSRPPSRAAQQDSVSRLSRAKVEAKVESVTRIIYYPQSKPSSINPRSRRAQACATSINLFYMHPDLNDS